VIVFVREVRERESERVFVCVCVCAYVCVGGREGVSETKTVQKCV
jgi:hypothetical protein